MSSVGHAIRSANPVIPSLIVLLERLLDAYRAASCPLAGVTILVVTVVAALRELSLHYNCPFAP